MKVTSVILVLTFIVTLDSAVQNIEIPEMIKGKFEDDYGIRYKINDSIWTQLPKTNYHILKHNSEGQYLIARNDKSNSSEGGLYTRIDYMKFSNMKPYEWGFCLSVYNAETDSLAETAYQADRQNPRKGCNGFPFSRMKRVK